MLQAGWLRQQKFIFVIVLGGWKSRIKVVASMISGKRALPGWSRAPSHVLPWAFLYALVYIERVF